MEFVEVLSERKKLVDGMELDEYIAYVLFVDAFMQVIQDDFPNLFNEFTNDEKKMIKVVKQVFRKHGLKIDQYLPMKTAQKLMDNLERFWDGKFDLYDVLNWDAAGVGSIVLQARGHGLSAADDQRFAKFLTSQGLPVPASEDIGIEMDEKPFVGALKAAEDLRAKIDAKSQVTETIDVKRQNMKREAIRAVTNLQRNYYPADRDLDRLIIYLETLR